MKHSRYPLSHVRILRGDDDYETFVTYLDFRTAMHEFEIARRHDLTRVRPAPGLADFDDASASSSAIPRGSYFARRPDEKGRPRRKRGDPPPPMSDLLGEVRHD